MEENRERLRGEEGRMTTTQGPTSRGETRCGCCLAVLQICGWKKLDGGGIRELEVRLLMLGEEGVEERSDGKGG